MENSVKFCSDVVFVSVPVMDDLMPKRVRVGHKQIPMG